MSSQLLPILILIPLLVGILLCAFGRRVPMVASHVGVLVAILMLVGSVFLLAEANSSDPSRTQATAAEKSLAESSSLIRPHLIYSPQWMRLQLPISIYGHPVDWQLQLGADGLSASLILLTSIVSLAVLIAARQQIAHRLELYVGLILIVQSLLHGVFLAMDLLLFYIFFEAILLPLVVLINVWGDPKDALKAARKFFLFTLAGSIPMVVGLVGLVVRSASPDRPTTVLLADLSKLTYATQLESMNRPVASSENATANAEASLAAATQVATHHTIILFTLLLGLGIKMALLPLHSWLPTTYEAAHPNTTALIASVVGKLGIYGVIRLVWPLTPLAMIYYAQWLFGALGAIAIVYGAMVALGQTDLRRLLAYSSLSHMGFVTLGVSAMNREGLAGASLQMFNHGLITAALFLLLASVEQRRGRLAFHDEHRGLAAAYPLLGTLMVFFTLAAVGLPGLNSFVGELMTMTGMMRFSLLLTAVAVLGTVLGAWYGLRVLQYWMFGSSGQTNQKSYSAADLSFTELSALLPIAALCLAIGVVPNYAMHFLRTDIDRMVAGLEPSIKAMHAEVDASMLVSQTK